MSELSLYYSCLKTISHLLIKRRVNEGPRQVNPFQFLPSKVLDDLVTATLQIQKGGGYRAASLKLLLTSGKIREFQIHSQHQIDELVCSYNIKHLRRLQYELKLSLISLSTACRNLEVLILTELSGLKFPESPRFMTEFIRNCPKLKYIHSEVAFNLKALRHCKELKTVMLHFCPSQRLSGFLNKNEQGDIESLKSLELFTTCYPPVNIKNDDLLTILQNCPALISFGEIDTSGVLAKLHRTSVLSQVNLRYCCWGQDSYCEPERISDAMIYHPFVEELNIDVCCKEHIASISTLTNLVYLKIDFLIEEEDVSEIFYNGLKVIGPQLKYLSLRSRDEVCPVDLSMSLENCPNLEVLIIDFTFFNEFAKPSISLPNLKYLDVAGAYDDEEIRLWSLFCGCNNLIKLKSEIFHDRIFNKFLNRNSLLNLKVASFRPCSMTKRGFKNLFLNAPELEIFEASDSGILENCQLEEKVRQALLETNHKAVFIDSMLRRRDLWCYRDSNFGIFDEFISIKKGCYCSNSRL